MPGIFDKMNLKDEREIVVLNAPESFLPEIKALKDVKVHRDVKGLKELVYSLAFVTRQAELDTISKAVASLAGGDAQAWFAYPKGTSKKYKCEFNRDNGWDVLKGLGWQPVRQVAIDEDWSALRFRRTEYVKSK